MPASRQQAERNSLLVERRKLVGREAWTVSMSDSRYTIHEAQLCVRDILQVHATTSQTLKHQIELQRYREAGSIVTLRDVQQAEKQNGCVSTTLSIHTQPLRESKTLCQEVGMD